MITRLQEQARDAQESSSVLGATEDLEPCEAQRLMTHPLPHWVERMTVSYLKAHGGKAERNRRTWNLTWPDGEELTRSGFQRQGGRADTDRPASDPGRLKDSGLGHEAASFCSRTTSFGRIDSRDH